MRTQTCTRQQLASKQQQHMYLRASSNSPTLIFPWRDTKVEVQLQEVDKVWNLPPHFAIISSTLSQFARMDVNLSVTLVMMESQMLPVATDHRDLLKYEHEHLAD